MNFGTIGNGVAVDVLHNSADIGVESAFIANTALGNGYRVFFRATDGDDMRRS
jgi:hypothetical protein